MVLVELPVRFDDLYRMMGFFKDGDSDIDSCIVEAQGRNLVVNMPERRNDEEERTV